MALYICYARTELALTLITSRLLHHVQAFDFETGLPKRCVKMVSWPLMDRLSRPFWDHLGRAALESFVPTKTTEGFLVMFDRSDSTSPCTFVIIITSSIITIILLTVIVIIFNNDIIMIFIVINLIVMSTEDMFDRSASTLP